MLSQYIHADNQTTFKEIYLMSQQKRISRRRFLIGAGAAGLGLAACSGAGILAVQEPHIEFSELSCGQRASDQGKVLVTYASQFGSTGEVAAAIAQTLCERGLAADVRLVAYVNDLSPYRAVIVGAPVHSNEWLPEAVNFVRTNRNSLSKLPVAYFLTCMTLGLTDRPEEKQKIAGVLEKVQGNIPEVIPVGKGLFAGALDYSKMSFMYRMIYQVVAPDHTTGDFRDWAAIRAWAEIVGPKLQERN
jgi:menaquinone-dependent protoporphyrinogen oxidase